MSRFALAAAVTLLCTATPALGAEPDRVETATFETLWEGAAWEAEIVDGVVVLLEGDLRHLSGFDVKTGKRRWRRTVLKETSGYHTLEVVDGRLFFWAGGTLLELSPKSGKVLKKGQLVHNRQSCALTLAGSLGAASCEVGLWLFGLDPISLGAYFPASEVHMYHDLSEPHTTHYLHSARTLLGAAGDLAVVAIQDDESKRHGFFTAPAILAGADPKSGELRWKTSELVRSGLTWGGVLDGRVAWVISESTRAAGAVDATSGKLIWKVEAQVDDDNATPFNGDVFGDGATAVVLSDDVVSWRDLRTGAERFKAAGQGVTRVVALGGQRDPLVYGGDKPRKLGLATADGRLVVVDLPPYATAARDGDTFMLVFAGHVQRYDTAGKLVSDVSGPQVGSFTVARGPVGGIDVPTGGEPSSEVVYTASGSRVAGVPDNTYLAAGRGDIAVLITRPKERDKPGTARLVRLKDRAQGTRR